MRFSRARYVTLCQQSLVTAAVLAVGLSAAGVKTLDIVPAPGKALGATGPGTAARGAASRDVLSVGPRTLEKSRVDSAPVTPKVREVAVTTPATRTMPAPAARRVQPRASTATQGTPKTSARTSSGPSSRTSSKPGVVETTPQVVRGYATVGVTWKHGVNYADNQIAITIRTKDKGAWSKWMKVEYHDDHGPDSISSEEESAKERPGTDALVIGDVDYVQMRAVTADGSTPPDMKLAIVDPGSGKMSRQAPAIDTAKLPSPTKGGAGGSASQADPQASGVTTLEGDGVSDQVTLSAMTRPAKPVIYSRAQWGANEKLREQGPPNYGTVKTGFVHHTVNANSYTRAQVPALLRGIYAYHTQSKGWRDIGYNYLVDRFGRIWEGRYGGVSRAVVGAHTLGFNEVSFAMSAIGNFDIAKPPPAVVAAYTRLFAWKLAIYNIRANNPRVLVKGRYLHAINGHRDVGQTACPGRYLYARLPYIRNRGRNIQLAAQKGVGSTPTTTAPKPPAPPPPSTTFTSPTQAPRTAVAQPAITFPKASNVVGSAYPDLVVKSRSNGAIRVVPTEGQTGFRGKATTTGSWSAMNLLSAVGDVTGDGKGDVLARIARTAVTRVYAGDGNGHIARAGTNATAQFRSADFVAGAGDWNKDGRADVLMRTRASGTLYVLYGTGKGTFGGARLLGKGWAGYTGIAPVGDLTGDGRPDLVGLKAGSVYIAPGTTAGVGTAVRQATLGAQWNSLVGAGGDLSGDGVGDVVVRSTAGALKILTGKSGGTFGPVLGPFSGAQGLQKLSAGQMGGGTGADVVGMSADGKLLTVVLSNGLTNVGKSTATNLRVPDATQVLNVGDWNRDGKADVVTREGGGDTLMLRPGGGDGTFGTGVLLSKGWAPFTHLSAVGDVTGDTFPDLVGKTATGAMTIFPGNGKTGFLAPILAPATLRTFNEVGTGSWRSGSLPGSAFLSPDGAFVPYAGTNGGALAGYDWVIGPGDVDGDGVADLVVRDAGGTLWLLPGTSQGYLERRFLASGYAGYSLGG